MIPIKPTHVLYQEASYIPSLYLGNHSLEVLPDKGRAAYSVVGIVLDIGKAAAPCVVLQKCLLVGYAVAFARAVILFSVIVRTSLSVCGLFSVFYILHLAMFSL